MNIQICHVLMEPIIGLKGSWIKTILRERLFLNDFIYFFSITVDLFYSFETLASILSELDVDEKGTRVIKNNSLSDFVRMSLSVVSNSYMYNIFPDSRVMSRLVSNKAKNEFIAFRKKYLNISNEF